MPAINALEAVRSAVVIVLTAPAILAALLVSIAASSVVSRVLFAERLVSTAATLSCTISTLALILTSTAKALAPASN